MLNTLDYIILGLTAFFFILGIIKGFLKQLFSFLGMIIVFTCGSILTPYAQEWLSGVIPDESLRSVVAMVASYLVLFIVWALLTALIIKLLTKIKIIGFLNRVLGGLLGIATIYVICAVVFALVLSTNESFLPTIKNLLNQRRVPQLDCQQHVCGGQKPNWGNDCQGNYRQNRRNHAVHAVRNACGTACARYVDDVTCGGHRKTFAGKCRFRLEAALFTQTTCGIVCVLRLLRNVTCKHYWQTSSRYLALIFVRYDVTVRLFNRRQCKIGLFDLSTN